MSFFFKNLGAQIFSSNIVAIIIRTLIIFIIVVLLLPLIFPSLIKDGSRSNLIIYAILSVVVMEFIALKISSALKNEKSHTRQAMRRSMGQTTLITSILNINRSRLSLMLYDDSIDLDKLMPKSLYSEIRIGDTDNYRLFNHYLSPVLCVKINACEKISNTEESDSPIMKLFRFVNKSQSNNIYFIISYKNITNTSEQDNYISSILKNIYSIKNIIDKKFNIHLLLDDMGSCPGFNILVDNMLNKTDVFAMSYTTNIHSDESISDIFDIKFKAFIERIEKNMFGLNINNVGDMRSAQEFVQSLQYNKNNIKGLLLNLTKICKTYFLYTFNTINFSVQLSHSNKEMVDTVKEIASENLKSCIDN